MSFPTGSVGIFWHGGGSRSRSDQCCRYLEQIQVRYIGISTAVYIPILHGLCKLDDSEHRVDKRYNYLFIYSAFVGELLLLSTSYLYTII